MLGEIRLGITLVGAFKLIGEGSVFDASVAMVFDDGIFHIVEALYLAGTAIKNTRELWIFP